MDMICITYCCCTCTQFINSNIVRIMVLFCLDHSLPETVELSLMAGDSTLYHTHFSYVLDRAQFVDELLKSVQECRPLQTSALPPLSSPDALREFDQTLVSRMRSVTLPEEWSLVGRSGNVCAVYKCTPNSG